MTEPFESAASPVSRRWLLPSGLGLAISAAAGLGAVAAKAAEKASKEVAQYRGRANGGQKCGGCAHYIFPVTCDAVAGPVISQGWCKFYKPRG